MSFFVIFDAAHAAQEEAALCPGCAKEEATSVKRFWQLMLQKDFWNEQAEVFRRNMRRGRVITLTSKGDTSWAPALYSTASTTCRQTDSGS